MSVEKSKEKEPVVKKKKLSCSICERYIPSGEYYSKSIISGKITCSNCDKCILIKGEFLFFPNE